MITSIQFRSQQVGARTYDAVILNVGGMRFSSDVNPGHSGDLVLRKARRLAEDAGVPFDCFEEHLTARLAALAP